MELVFATRMVCLHKWNIWQTIYLVNIIIDVQYTCFNNIMTNDGDYII